MNKSDINRDTNLQHNKKLNKNIMKEFKKETPFILHSNRVYQPPEIIKDQNIMLYVILFFNRFARYWVCTKVVPNRQ